MVLMVILGLVLLAAFIVICAFAVIGAMLVFGELDEKIIGTIEKEHSKNN